MIFDWCPEPDGSGITVGWVGGRLAPDARVDVDEDDEAVRLTASCEPPPARLSPSTGRPLRENRRGYSHTARTQLAAPLGKRVVVDTQHPEGGEPTRRPPGWFQSGEVMRFIEATADVEVRGWSDDDLTKTVILVVIDELDLDEIRTAVQTAYGTHFDVIAVPDLRLMDIVDGRPGIAWPGWSWD